jgi:hypothetical protein
MLRHLAANGAKTIIVESPDRFARDLAVQLAGHDMLKALGLAIIPASAPDFFTEDTPTAVLVRQVLGAIALLRSWQQLGNASVSATDHAREENRSVRLDPMLSASRVSSVGVDPRVVWEPICIRVPHAFSLQNLRWSQLPNLLINR